VTDRYDTLFREMADEFDLDWTYLKAQAVAESNLNPYAASRVGAVGLTQFMPKTWEWIAGNDRSPFCPKHAIWAQAKYMRYLVDRVGSVRKALAAYNWGEGNVRKHTDDWEAAMPQETRDYVARIDRLRSRMLS